MRFEMLSPKQREIFRFIFSDHYALICDGAVRSGKTTVMVTAFLIWAMEHFDRTNFGICGKTVQSAERNVLKPLQQNEDLPYTMAYKVSTRVLTVKCGGKVNWFYLFGGKDESSYMLIQGITLAGVFFDEVALMPKSFVEQALSRAISYKNPKYFFNCNPESPGHYFYKEWIETPRENTTRLHFLLEDNPILTEEMIERTKSMYSGVFYDRYIRGLWVSAEGLIYPMFDPEQITTETPWLDDDGRARRGTEFYLSIDYGILNPFSAGLWAVYKGRAYRWREYYYDGRKTNQPRTDEEHYGEVEKLVEDIPVESVVIDPSASSFRETIRRHGRFHVRNAVNDVAPGIATVATLLKAGRLLIHKNCESAIKEFGLYLWDPDASERGKDAPIKDNDHAMDDIRYFCHTILQREFDWLSWG